MTLRFHREGRKIIPVAFILIGVILSLLFFLLKGGPWIWLCYLLSIGGLVLFGLVLNFFRNPVIGINPDEGQILSPCDGKVVVIEEVEDKVYFHDKVRQISIFMSPLNVHVNRNPIGGEVKHAAHIPGEFLVAFDPKSSERNEQTYVVTANDQVTVAYKQIAGYVARRICCYIKEGDQVEQGEEFGFIKFGSRIDILMPLSCKVLVNLEDKVLAGRSIIAEV